MVNFIVIFIGLIFAKTFDGSTVLSDKYYDYLQINGDAELSNIEADEIKVYGKLKADNINVGSLYVMGDADINKINSNLAKFDSNAIVNGGNLDVIYSNKFLEIKNLRIEDLYIKHDISLFAVRANNIFAYGLSGIRIQVADRCYIDNIEFNLPGDVFINKDRSYVGNVISGKVHR